MSVIPVRRAFFLLVGLLLMSAVLAKDVPYLSGRVNDQAGLLSDAGIDRITSILQRLEQAKGAQVAVLTVPGLHGEPVEKYSMRVVEAWKLGRKGVDDGVLLLVARDDRRIRIEVGYGLEGVLTDLDSRRIIDNMMQPAFRQGDFEGGVEAAVKAIGDLVTGELEQIPGSGLSAASGLPNGAGMVLGFFALLLLPLVPMAIALKGRQGWTLFTFMAPFSYILPSILSQTTGLISVVAWLVLIPLLRFIWPKDWRIDPGKGSNSVGLGRGGSRRSGGGGFSGGGGSFGGGGASGGW